MKIKWLLLLRSFNVADQGNFGSKEEKFNNEDKFKQKVKSKEKEKTLKTLNNGAYSVYKRINKVREILITLNNYSLSLN